MRPRIRPDETADRAASAADVSGADWYKDAVIYQVHVRAFLDSTGDGIGDFAGLTRKLDYIQGLGVSAIWLLPFYPSPLRDDGYDISHYQGVHARYGTKREFKAFMDEAHQRGLKIITELVINHTSDQHPWFQAARRARPGSSKRDFYVWSDTPNRYSGVPIVFKDSEPSNWTWDPVAGAYFWHRFFHHQPDLNFDNPLVQKALLKVMRFWLDMGVDGMRLDAVPYLVEREGTECANLPETHAILRTIRADMDNRYRGRMLLAEANQWPADVRAYFGDSDECHMAFHFPLMPRLYMALREEDRHPLSEILYQTPEIPDSCQWALFLRNHDELTLEMVSDEERDYMYETYASDPQMRLNAGIRRRLAPLLENSRARIELLNGLLLSLPGTPVLYYGDEIGMGDNVYLGDRNGVRTPMQWNADRNGGFSTADPARLYAPPIMDPVYGYQSVNVEAQERTPHSLLNWTRRMVALRRQHITFGRGSLELLRPLNRAIFAFIRRYQTEDPILVVANLSKTLQPVSLDLSALAGHIPVEMTGQVELPRLTDAPYFLTLSPHSFMWLLLKRPAAGTSTASGSGSRESEHQLAPLLLGPEWARILDGSVRQLLERRYLPVFLACQPWIEESPLDGTQVVIDDWMTLVSGEEPVFVVILSVRTPLKTETRYVLPLAMAAGERGEQIQRETPERVLARIGGARKGVLHSRIDGRTGRALLQLALHAQPASMKSGYLRGQLLDAADGFALPTALDALPPQPSDYACYHSAAVFGERVVLACLRRLWPGSAPEQQLPDALGRQRLFARIPCQVAYLDYVSAEGTRFPIALVEEFIPHQANGWKFIRGEVDRVLDGTPALGTAPLVSHDPATWWSLDLPDAASPVMAPSAKSLALLGRRIAELHRGLSNLKGPVPARPAVLEGADVVAFTECATAVWTSAKDLILSTRPDAAPQDAVNRISRVLSDTHAVKPGLPLIPIHGNLSLSHVLMHEGDFTIIGLAARSHEPPDRRLAPRCALQDLASLLVSMCSATESALNAYSMPPSPHLDHRQQWVNCWRAWAAASVLRGYQSVTAVLAPAEAESAARLLRLLVLTCALQAVADDSRSRAETLPRSVAVARSLLAKWMTDGPQ